MLAGLLDVNVHGSAQMSPRAKSASSFGTAASNPATSIDPGSSGSAMLKSVAVMPTTDSRAGMPVSRRYRSRAWCGCICPAHVSLSVYTEKCSAWMPLRSAQSIGSEQSVRPKLSRAVRAMASSSRILGLMSSGTNSPVNPMTAVLGSVAAVTSASAAAASRQVSGNPETGEVIDPDTSTPRTVRLPDGSATANER